MVQMTIPYRLDLTTTVTLDISKFDGQWYLGWGCEAIEVFDYYTGTVVPGEDMSTDDDKPTDISGNATQPPPPFSLKDKPTQGPPSSILPLLSSSK